MCRTSRFLPPEVRPATSSFFLCPSCSQKRTLLFAEHLDEQLLLTLPHRQFVFTLPKALRVSLGYEAKVYEVDPLICPRCGSEMKLIALITDPPEVRKILRHLLKIGRAPPGLDSSSLN